jgi:hypothetical protein
LLDYHQKMQHQTHPKPTNVLLRLGASMDLVLEFIEEV